MTCPCSGSLMFKRAGIRWKGGKGFWTEESDGQGMLVCKRVQCVCACVQGFPVPAEGATLACLAFG